MAQAAVPGDVTGSEKGDLVGGDWNMAFMTFHMAVCQNPGTPGEPQNSWDYVLIINYLGKL